MIPKRPKTEQSAVAPDKYPQGDLFLIDVADAAMKDLIPTMEYPFYSLSKKPDYTAKRYEFGDKWVEITPSSLGHATIYDKDILIFVVSQLMHCLNNGEEISRNIRVSPMELLRFINRGTGGADYKRLNKALLRLAGTVISTNVTTYRESSDVPMGEEESIGYFHLLESAVMIRANNTASGRVIGLNIQISEWLFNSIRRNHVLTLSKDYFRLRRPMDRRIYELARKMCGSQERFDVSIKKLFKRVGAKMSIFQFRHVFRELVKSNHLPDYLLEYDEIHDRAIFIGRGSVQPAVVEMFEGRVDADVYDHIRHVAPGWDPRHIEHQWRLWCGEEEIVPKHPTRHLIKFATSWFEKRGRP